VAATLSWAGGSTRRKGCRVAEPWALSYESLRTSSRAVLRGMAVVELRTLPEADLLAAGGISENSELRPVITELADSGWICSEADGWRVATAPGRWLAHLAHRVDSAQAIDHVTRFAAHLREVVAADRDPLRASDANRGAAIVAAVRAAGRHGLAELGIALAAAAWQAALPGGDRDWWRQLAKAGEDVAIEARNPVALVGPLETSGAAFARAGDTHLADRQWRRAFALTEQLGDRERSAALLGEIGLLRRTSGSFGRALTAFYELVAVRQELNDQLGLADALTELATTLMRADRATDARHYLERAEEALPHSDAIQGAIEDGIESAARVRHAQILIKLGRCWDQQKEPAASMSCYSRALAELIDVDDETAAVARSSLAAAARARATQAGGR
jgi:tetratricopeptide (TPR) repeat protein